MFNNLDLFDYTVQTFRAGTWTLLPPEVILENITGELIASGYRITSQTDNIIKFDYNGNYRFNDRIQPFKMLEEGVFEVSSTENKSIIKLIYYVDMTADIALILLCIFCACITTSWEPLILAVGMGLLLLLRIYSVKNVAAKLLSNF
ncbi:hypothetical protein [Mucilaginibacter celer]|uniref:Uncharacterized protein n=1 Tax=Mucilaginibacter celer TaxID=2305508 RepID=A0A494W2E4_9SPHI|nr:hypothetical protein [Mucilaginibacter celer]AYL97728.1 hypothetical protein HYN43_021600 [Mucilaginibacter celer]